LAYQTNTWRMLTTNMFKVRIEEDGAVIYRKHWILLLQSASGSRPWFMMAILLVVLALSFPTLFATFSAPLVVRQ
jgi:hypothetical protein